MPNVINSHFYIVKGTPKNENGIRVFPTMGWMFHSYKEITEFSILVADLIPEYNLDITEITYGESQIMETWEIK